MIAVVTGWRYYWRRYLGFLPLQWCMVCGRAYYGGLPRFGLRRIGSFGRLRWQPSWKEYCSQPCADEELGAVARLESLADEDPRPKRAGWAPGPYACRCVHCGKTFAGDKRSVSCADCAYAATTQPPAPVPGNQERSEP